MINQTESHPDGYPKLTESRVIIRFQDCDPLQHLNNSKYFDYFFNSRSDQVSQLYGYNVADIFRQFKSGWVAYNHNISYIRPALPGEWVRIYTRLLAFSDNTQYVEYYMTDDHRTHIKCLLWSTMVYVDVISGKRIVHQPEITEALQRMVDFDHPYDIQHFSNPSIYHRLKELKTELAPG
ncbi:MAG: acyl-CoA thioesterase [Bacteroidia bacterium]|nr:acyl-CoA thioesterase [Bacteroidia bacterium]